MRKVNILKDTGLQMISDVFRIRLFHIFVLYTCLELLHSFWVI